MIDYTKEKVVPIWQPRNWNKMVLISTFSFTKDKVYFYFCADDNFKKMYYVNTDEVTNNCSICSNGKIDCYEIPYDMIYEAGEVPIEYYKQIEIEHEKYLAWKESKKQK